MRTKSASQVFAPARQGDGFEVLDACHQQTVVALDKRQTLVTRLESEGADAQVRALANEVIPHVSTTSRQHHADEERHIFPKLVVNGDPQTVQAVLCLQWDHNWIEDDWMELSPFTAAR